MSSNSVTGDSLITRPQSKEYDEGYDRIFSKGKKNKSETCNYVEGKDNSTNSNCVNCLCENKIK